MRIRSSSLKMESGPFRRQRSDGAIYPEPGTAVPFGNKVRQLEDGMFFSGNMVLILSGATISLFAHPISWCRISVYVHNILRINEI